MASVELQKQEGPEIVISGVGIGLPGKDKEIFDETNVERLLNGENFISKIGAHKMNFQKRQKIIQKRRNGDDIVFKELHQEDDLVKLAGESGRFDLIKEYGVGSGLIDAWEITTQLAIAACLEALKDAYIPLLDRDGHLSLPDEYVDSTGIIFASTFPSANTFLQEQSRFYNHVIQEERHQLATKLQDRFGEEAWDIVNELVSGDESYNFDRKYLLKAIPIQSGHIAQVINAKGPNTAVNAACASTTQAIAMAEDWIKLGRCKRVIVVGADDPTNETTFGWIATGFLAAGAATTEGEIGQAAKPFDLDRSGMILGMGAVGLVVETREQAEKRGIQPIAQILGSYMANSAYHGTRMDPEHVKRSFSNFMELMEKRHNLDLIKVAKSSFYMSHETFTPPKGNAAGTEIGALEAVFGDNLSDIIIGNTKGLTAHPMGVSIEDAAIIKAMEYNKLPPVVNLHSPEFNDVRFSKGEHLSFDYGIRFAAGFGSQLVYLLIKNYHHTERMTEGFEAWLHSCGTGLQLAKRGKTLIAMGV